jgi:large subunit ribosomal protein L13
MQRKKETTTTFVRKEDQKTSWYVFDAKGKTLGRLSTEIARVLCGKHKPSYTPYVDTGDGVIVINAEHVEVTGAKAGQKIYRYYTGHIGGLREVPYRQMLARKPEYVIEHAVKGMIPKSRLGKHILRKLRVFKGAEHPYEAQKPIKVEI